jgi:hypothetical protein
VSEASHTSEVIGQRYGRKLCESVLTSVCRSVGRGLLSFLDDTLSVDDRLDQRIIQIGLIRAVCSLSRIYAHSKGIDHARFKYPHTVLMDCLRLLTEG